MAGLTLALAFSVLLNVMILGTVVWPEWLETHMKLGCGAGVALLWLLALWETRGELRRLELRRANEIAEREQGNELAASGQPENENDQLLRAAQRQYLCGDWVTAEKELRKAIAANRHDVEARLWYATLLRRTKRENQALRRLRSLERLDDAATWRYEIEREKALCLAVNEPLTEPVAEPDIVAIRTDASSPVSPPDEQITRRAA